MTGSLALVLIESIVSGMLNTLLILLPESISNYFKYKSLLRENSKVKDEIRQQKEKVVFADDISTAHAAVITPDKGIQ